MSNNDKLYKILNAETLKDFGVATFGKIPSSDFIQFKKFIKTNDKLLEIGTGIGRLTLQFIDLDIHYTGLEKQKTYLNVVKREIKLRKISTEKYTLLNKSFEDLNKNKTFNIIIFSWTVIGDFNKKEQLLALKKTFSHLDYKGLCLIDNPAEGQPYNKHKNYRPTNFYYKEWKDIFTKIGFLHKVKIYKTKTGISRELIILTKPREGPK